MVNLNLKEAWANKKVILFCVGAFVMIVGYLSFNMLLHSNIMANWAFCIGLSLCVFAGIITILEDTGIIN